MYNKSPGRCSGYIVPQTDIFRRRDRFQGSCPFHFNEHFPVLPEAYQLPLAPDTLLAKPDRLPDQKTSFAGFVKDSRKVSSAPGVEGGQLRENRAGQVIAIDSRPPLRARMEVRVSGELGWKIPGHGVHIDSDPENEVRCRASSFEFQKDSGGVAGHRHERRWAT